MADTGRDPISTTRQAGETGTFALLAMYAAQILLPQAPPEVQAAAAAAATSVASGLFSFLRNSRIGGRLTGAR